jgi:hypothetical protein
MDWIGSSGYAPLINGARQFRALGRFDDRFCRQHKAESVRHSSMPGR